MNIDDQIDQQTALNVACPPRDEHGCGQPVGQLCRNLASGEPLRHLPAHLARLRAAGVRHDPLNRDQLVDNNRSA